MLGSIASNTADTSPDDGIVSYNSKDPTLYANYIERQKQKLSLKFNTIKRFDKELEEIVYKDLNMKLPSDVSLTGKSVLCLGARLGGEVRAFKRMGSLTVGIDLNPGHGNQHVLQGDFHHLQWPDHVFDFAFSNVIGHIFSLEDFGKEVCRILKKDGIFIMDARPDIVLNESTSKSKTRIEKMIGFESLIYKNATSLLPRLAMDTVKTLDNNFLMLKCRS